MCAIFAYINYLSPKNRSEIIGTLLQGLSKIRCSGCDSIGIVVDPFMNLPNSPALRYFGQANIFLQSIQAMEGDGLAIIHNSHSGIGHTFKDNHPVFAYTRFHFGVVHKGNVTNTTEIESTWGQFDTDLISELIQRLYEQNPHCSLYELLGYTKLMKGSYALMIKHNLFLGKFAATRHGLVPLFVGIKTTWKPSSVPVFYYREAAYRPRLGNMSMTQSSSQSSWNPANSPVEYFVASELSAVIDHTQYVVVLKDGDVVYVEDGALCIYRIESSEGSSATQTEQTRPVHDMAVVTMHTFSAHYLGSTEISNVDSTGDCRRALQTAKTRVRRTAVPQVVLEVSLSGLNIRDLDETVLHCHPIGNIQLVCQDEVDKNFFAIILQEGARRFYHLFYVATPAIANEIIETLDNATKFTYNI